MIIGVTSSMGCGSSTVSKMLKKFGAKVINADEIGQELLDTPKVKLKLTKVFGEKILRSHKIDRNRLAELAFKNKTNTAKLNDITHPLIIKEIKSQLKTFKKKSTPIVLDAPLLFELGLDKLVNRVIVVSASREKQLIRLQDKGFTEAQVEQRLKAQMPLREKTALADYVIDNNGAKKITEKKVKELWETLTR